MSAVERAAPYNRDATLPISKFAPNRWPTTRRNWAKEIYRPKTRQEESHPGFIACTKNPISEIQETQTMTWVRADLLSRAILRKGTDVQEAFCFGHGEFVNIKFLDADHVQPSADISRRQRELISRMNHDEDFATEVMKFSFMRNYIIESNEVIDGKSVKKYFGSTLFFKVFHNDIENLWLVCKGCNGGSGKRDMDPIEWFKLSEWFGQSFLNEIGEIETNGIVFRIKKNW